MKKVKTQENQETQKTANVIEQPQEPRSLTLIIEPTSGFEVVKKGKYVSYLTVNKRVFALNHHSEPLLGAKEQLIPVTTQEELKAIYDSDPVNAQFVKAPEGYKAEWSKFQ